MSFIIDTCVLSELRKPVPDSGVLNWFESIAEDEIFVSSLTLGELQFGISLLENSRQKNDLITWFEILKDRFQYQTVPVSHLIALRWGEICANLRKKGKAVSVVDGLIGATALEEDAVLVTRNISDFESIEVKLLNPWI